MGNVRLISATPDIEQTIAYIARVSSDNQDNPSYEKLFKYLLDHKHFSPFEHGFLTVEIVTNRGIAAQILRHRSFTFQEISQRYQSNLPDRETIQARAQAAKNRQSSVDSCTDEVKEWFEDTQHRLNTAIEQAYQEAIGKGIAREQARFLLPLSTGTKLYMSGSVRSFLHYIELRTQPDTQLEHRQVAEEIREVLVKELPTVAKIMEW